MMSEAELCLFRTDICLPQCKQQRLRRSPGSAMSVRLRMSKFLEGEGKGFGGFPSGHLHIKASWDVQHVYS